MPSNHFDYVPSGISDDRSVFRFEKAIAMGVEIGYLYPICKPVAMMPGSTLKLDLACEVRSGALISPLQDELIADFFAFNVPNRIVWEHWKQFLGSTDDVLFDNLTEYQIPHFEYCGAHYQESVSAPYLASHLLACCMELPYLAYRNKYAEGISPAGSGPLAVSALPFRGYNFIWNEFFRPEQLVDPVLFSKTDVGNSGANMDYDKRTITFNSQSLTVFVDQATPAIAGAVVSGGVVLPTFRVHKSLWTSCLPKPSLETLNLLAGLTAPIGFISQGSGTIGSVSPTGTSVNSGSWDLGEFVQQVASNSATTGGGTDIVSQYQPVIADLNQALLTVNNYRETIMLQNYYDALNRAGSRYDEIIRNIFHTQVNFGVIDIPELIVHKRFTIYRKDVVAQAQTYDDEGAVTTNLGQQASYIDTVVRDSFFTKSTTEHGYIHMLTTIRPSRIRMAQGIEPDWLKLNKFDMYYPQFDGMGDVPRLKMELFISSTQTANDCTSIFGYQEYGAEWKYQRNSATGWCDVNLAGYIPGLTLCEKLSSQPALTGVFGLGFNSYISCLVEEEAFARCLALSNPSAGPQFILDIRLTGEIVHPMPVYNIPGMGDLL